MHYADTLTSAYCPMKCAPTPVGKSIRVPIKITPDAPGGEKVNACNVRNSATENMIASIGRMRATVMCTHLPQIYCRAKRR